jgi:hypothetical protein
MVENASLLPMDDQSLARLTNQYFPHLEHLGFWSVARQTQLHWFRQFESLETLNVIGVTDSTVGCMPPRKVLKRLHITRYSGTVPFNCLAAVSVTKELSIQDAPSLTSVTLADHFKNGYTNIQRLHLAETSAVDDMLLDGLLLNNIKLKWLNVPILEVSLCRGFSNAGLEKYMTFNPNLEVLVIRGHEEIDSGIWNFLVNVFDKMVLIDVVRTEIERLEPIVLFSHHLQAYRYCTIRRRPQMPRELTIFYFGERDRQLESDLKNYGVIIVHKIVF